MINKRFDWHIRALLILGIWLILIVLIGIFSQPHLHSTGNFEYREMIKQERQVQLDGLAQEYFNKLTEELKDEK